MLYEGALLAILVVWLFLRDWRATLIAATALPLSILPTFAAMQWLGYSLNTLTLLALAAVVGPSKVAGTSWRISSSVSSAAETGKAWPASSAPAATAARQAPRTRPLAPNFPAL